jgi:serine/threonine protein kinase
LSNLTNGIKRLQDIGISHQNIQPACIIVNGSGEIKLMDLPSFEDKNTGYNRMMISNDYYAPLSPELLSALYIRQAKPRHDVEKSDMFSLGITMLCAATNEHFSTFYDFREF